MFRTLALLSLLSLTSCAGAPEKPSFELGVIDYPAGQVIVNETNGKSMQRIDSVAKASHANVIRAIVAGGQRVPLASYDRAIAITPDNWTIFINYVHALERYAQNHCGN